MTHKGVTVGSEMSFDRDMTTLMSPACDPPVLQSDSGCIVADTPLAVDVCNAVWTSHASVGVFLP